MANEDHQKRLKGEIAAWNHWREKNPDLLPDLRAASLVTAHLFRANLSKVNLINANLTKANLVEANLTKANLSQAVLHEADLMDANLNGAILRNVKLNNAKLQNADLTGASLNGAYLTKAILDGSILAGANLTGARLFGTSINSVDLNGADLSTAMIIGAIFGEIDLSKVIGLETVTHFRASTIGIDTIYRSGGNIPASFLRGCGVPDNFIAFTKSLVGKAIEYYSAFISYSSGDVDLARRIYTDLQAKGIRCWLAPEDLKIGEKFRLKIEDSIRLHDKLLLILSEQSIASKWVKYEVENALDREVEQDKLIIFPIRIDDAVMETDVKWADRIKSTRHIGDFTSWKDHDSYQKAFERLLQDLQVKGS